MTQQVTDLSLRSEKALSLEVGAAQPPACHHVRLINETHATVARNGAQGAGWTGCVSRIRYMEFRGV